jgi:DNA-binding HxlR family transcriptional regulator
MKRERLAEMECSVARTLAHVGDGWTVLVLRDAFYGVRRFDDFQRDLGVARNILTDRLSRLVGDGLLERRRYQERPPRYEYVLTEKGRDLLPVLLSLMRWGDRWAADEPSVTLTHTTCGRETTPVVCCEHCGGELDLHNVRAHPIPIRGAS